MSVAAWGWLPSMLVPLSVVLLRLGAFGALVAWTLWGACALSLRFALSSRCARRSRRVHLLRFVPSST